MGQELDPSGSRMGILLQELEAAAEEALSSGGDRKAKVPAPEMLFILRLPLLEPLWSAAYDSSRSLCQASGQRVLRLQGVEAGMTAACASPDTAQTHYAEELSTLARTGAHRHQGHRAGHAHTVAGPRTSKQDRC